MRGQAHHVLHVSSYAICMHGACKVYLERAINFANVQALSEFVTSLYLNRTSLFSAISANPIDVVTPFFGAFHLSLFDN